MDIPSAKNIADAASVLAPGFIILSIRSRFVEGTVPEIKDRIIAYAIVSTAYYAAISPFFQIPNGFHLPKWLWGFFQYFFIPVIIGFAAAYANQFNLAYKAAKLVRLRLTHHIPAAWDYAFSNIISGTYVLVKLHSGTQFAGIMGKASFASSSREERDLLIEEVWLIDNNGNWMAAEPRRSVLLCGKDIRQIEIFRRQES